LLIGEIILQSNNSQNYLSFFSNRLDILNKIWYLNISNHYCFQFKNLKKLKDLNFQFIDEISIFQSSGFQTFCGTTE